jgi:hypothetical protein
LPDVWKVGSDWSSKKFHPAGSIYSGILTIGIPMSKESEIERARRRRLRHAEGKLRDAQIRLARNERSIVYWSRKAADLRHERIRAVQPPLWPEEGTHEES